MTSLPQTDSIIRLPMLKGTITNRRAGGGSPRTLPGTAGTLASLPSVPSLLGKYLPQVSTLGANQGTWVTCPEKGEGGARVGRVAAVELRRAALKRNVAISLFTTTKRSASNQENWLEMTPSKDIASTMPCGAIRCVRGVHDAGFCRPWGHHPRAVCRVVPVAANPSPPTAGVAPVASIPGCVENEATATGDGTLNI